jgi:hypothetical protein
LGGGRGGGGGSHPRGGSFQGGIISRGIISRGIIDGVRSIGREVGEGGILKVKVGLIEVGVVGIYGVEGVQLVVGVWLCGNW